MRPVRASYGSKSLRRVVNRLFCLLLCAMATRWLRHKENFSPQLVSRITASRDSASRFLLIATLARRRRRSGHHGNLASGIAYVYGTELNEGLRRANERSDHI